MTPAWYIINSIYTSTSKTVRHHENAWLMSMGTSKIIEIYALETIGVILPKRETTKALVSLCSWLSPFVFRICLSRFSHAAQISLISKKTLLKESESPHLIWLVYVYTVNVMKKRIGNKELIIWLHSTPKLRSNMPLHDSTPRLNYMTPCPSQTQCSRQIHV